MAAGKKNKKKKSKTAKRRRISRAMARMEQIARKLGQVAPEDDPAQVAGAIAIFAARTIQRSASNLREARAYLDGLRAGIDGLLMNAFPETRKKPEGDDA